MLFNSLQLANAHPPIYFIVFGRVTEVRFTRQAKAVDMVKLRTLAKSRLTDGSYAFWNNNIGEVLTTEESAIIDDGSTLWDDGMAVLNRKMCHRSVCIKRVNKWILWVVTLVYTKNESKI